MVEKVIVAVEKKKRETVDYRGNVTMDLCRTIRLDGRSNGEGSWDLL